MRWKGLVIGLGLVVAAGTACGQRADNVSPGAQPAPAPATSSSPSVSPPPVPGRHQTFPPADAKPVAATQADFAALPEGFPHEVWVSPDGKTLYARAEEGGCGRASAELREETPQRVVVALVEDQRQLTGRMCTMYIRYPVVSVPLVQPLGDCVVVLQSEKRPL